MEIFLDYLKVFAVGGALCALGQLLINKTQMSSARILVTFMLLGVVLELAGAFSYMKEFASAGVTIPITGFGSGLARGALRGAKEGGIARRNKRRARSRRARHCRRDIFGFVFSLVFKSHSKKL